MFIAVVSWWYTAGWKRLLFQINERIDRYVDYFSFSLLVRTLFSPYRQISAGRVQGPLAVQWRAFVDRLVSRMIGAMIRIAVLIVGLVAVAIIALVGFIQLIIWPIVPVLPLLGIVASFIAGSGL